MPTEKERRFLLTAVDPELFRLPYKHIEQGYVSMEPEAMRSRVTDGEKGVFCYKQGQGIERDEDEKIVTDVEDAKFVLKGCKYRVRKHRYQRPGDPWEIDKFKDELKGIFFAEIEHPEAEKFSLPSWIGTGIEVTDSVSNWHLARLAYDLRTRSVEGSVRDLLLLPQRLPRIVFTGGPCSGKTKAMEVLKKELGDIVHFMPEMATMVITHGVKPSSDEEFQSFLYRTQRNFEAITDKQARADGKKLLILDRGSVDNAAYLPDGLEQFERLCRTKRKAEYALYDRVLCLDVAPEHVYEEEKRNNVARSEEYPEALAINDRINEVWSEHPDLRVVFNGRGWEEKLAHIRAEVRTFLSKYC